MEKIVVYQTSTGFTKQYAQWIAEEMKCEAVSIKDISAQTIKAYQQVIFGGWVMGNMIFGLDKIIKMEPQNLTVFAVGATPASIDIEATIKSQNHLENTPLYYFEGGFHFNKLSLPVKIMLKMLKKSAEKKENKTPQEEYMARILGTSFDHTNKKFIQPLLDACREV
ncbi:MAG: flavodoxin domain-containing protein [Oscillospiraceae bacterium]|nr:flavodoxin domain-containing protein [Oscillospiraceae bacterium]